MQTKGTVMAMLVALYKHPTNAAQFDSYYDKTHVPLGTPEGQATAADLGNFATGGVDLFIFDTRKA
jgi:hypothetical protein